MSKKGYIRSVWWLFNFYDYVGTKWKPRNILIRATVQSYPKNLPIYTLPAYIGT